MMQHISLFSGIGGFDLASEWMGWTNVASCEINPFGRKVLDYYWPNAYHHDDIHTLTKELLIEKSNWNEQEPTILTGGFPCQPYSTAGKRLGKEDERHLWPEMLRVIRFVRPSWIVGENVHGIISWSDGLVFDEVQADLEAEGYEVWPYILPACGVNAPHRRDRVWFVAWNTKSARKAEEREVQRGQNTVPDRVCGTIQGTVVDSDKCNDRRITREDESESGEERVQERNAIRKSFKSSEILGPAADTQHNGHPATERGRSDGEDCQRSQEGKDSTKQFVGVCESGQLGDVQRDATNAKGSRGKRERKPRHRQTQFDGRGFQDAQQAWGQFPTQPPICGGNDGLPTELDGITFSKWRNESIKASGNAIVPQVVLQIFKTIEQFESVYLNPTNANE